jgi:anti-anti-sigma factor
MLTIPAGFEIEQVRGITVVRFTIDVLTEENFETIAEDLHSLLCERRLPRVVVDMASIQRIDDLGLAMVQSFHDSIEELGGTAILCRLNSSVLSTMNQSGLDRLLHIRPSFNEAVWTF